MNIYPEKSALEGFDGDWKGSNLRLHFYLPSWHVCKFVLPCRVRHLDTFRWAHWIGSDVRCAHSAWQVHQNMWMDTTWPSWSGLAYVQTYYKRAPATPFNLRIELSCFVKSIMGCIVYHSLIFFKSPLIHSETSQQRQLSLLSWWVVGARWDGWSLVRGDGSCTEKKVLLRWIAEKHNNCTRLFVPFGKQTWPAARKCHEVSINGHL